MGATSAGPSLACDPILTEFGPTVGGIVTFHLKWTPPTDDTVDGYSAQLTAATVAELERGLGSYLRFYNEERLHQSLDYQPPQVVHHGAGKVLVKG